MNENKLSGHFLIIPPGVIGTKELQINEPPFPLNIYKFTTDNTYLDAQPLEEWPRHLFSPPTLKLHEYLASHCGMFQFVLILPQNP